MSKVIFKLRFKHPNLKTTTSKNVAHLNYIATRPGVDKTITEYDRIQESEKSDFSDESKKEVFNNKSESHGLFSSEGAENLSEVKDKVKNVKSFVWRAVVSLKEEDAFKLGYDKKEKWQELMNIQMPKVADSMNIDRDNLKWVAAIHMEKGHPHTHIMFWENKPLKTSGTILPFVLEDIRKGFIDEIFEEERLNILLEKNAMRDLLKELTCDDISLLSREVKEEYSKVKEFSKEIDIPNIEPKLYSDYEKTLFEMIKNLSVNLPKKGRKAYEFMTPEIKEEVDKISSYIFETEEFKAAKEREKIAVINLAKLYTSDELKINKSVKDNEEDLKKRIGQIILKGAVEFQKRNFYTLNEKRLEEAVNFINNMNFKINKGLEKKQMVFAIGDVMYKSGWTDEKIEKFLNLWLNKNDISLPENYLSETIENIKQQKSNFEILQTTKKIDIYLAVFKTLGLSEEDTFTTINDIVKLDGDASRREFENLVTIGLMRKENKNFKLTTKGIDEFLKIKTLDVSEQEILNVISKESDVNFNKLADDKDILSSIFNKEPKEVILLKFDYYIYNNYFKSDDDDNKSSIAEITAKIFEKYSTEQVNENYEKIEEEIGSLTERLRKLVVYGFMKYDRKNQEYQFTDKALKELNQINKNMEFSKYDATVTMDYIDRENGLLTEVKLNEMCQNEIINSIAEKEYSGIKAALENEEFNIKQYITIDEEKNLNITNSGENLSKEIFKIKQVIYKTKGNLSESQLKNIYHGEEYSRIKSLIESLVEKEYIYKDEKTDTYKLDKNISSTADLAYRIFQNESPININEIKEVIKRFVPNKDADKHREYIIKRLNFLKDEGYIEGELGEYSITENGAEKRKDLLDPRRDVLRKTLDFLKTLNLIEDNGSVLNVTKKYNDYNNTVDTAKEQKLERKSDFLSKPVYDILNKTYNNVNIEKMQRINQALVNGKYFGNEYEGINDDYSNVREILNIKDITVETVESLSRILFIDNKSIDDVKTILGEWNNRSESKIDEDILNSAADKIYKEVEENNRWGKQTVISKEEWEKIFIALDVDSETAPKWIYGREGHLFQHQMMISIINSIWKSAWRQMETDRSQMEAEYMKRQLLQRGLDSKQAQKEQSIKNKSKGLYAEEELEK